MQEATSKVLYLGHDDDPDHITAMLRCIYNLPYMPPRDEDESPDSIFEVGVFAVADKYKVKKLRQAIVTSFQPRILWDEWDRDSSSTVLKRAFCPVISDKSFQEAIVSDMVSYRYLKFDLEDETFSRLLDEIPLLAKRLLEKTYEGAKERYECKTCEIFHKGSECPICKSSSSSVGTLLFKKHV